MIYPILPRPLKSSLTEISDVKKDELQAWEDQDLWQTLDMPIIVIHGNKDWIVKPGNVDFLEEQFEGKDNVVIERIKNGAHFILWKNYDRIKPHILDMLEK